MTTESLDTLIEQSAALMRDYNELVQEYVDNGMKPFESVTELYNSGRKDEPVAVELTLGSAHAIAFCLQELIKEITTGVNDGIADTDDVMFLILALEAIRTLSISIDRTLTGKGKEAE